MKNHLVLDVHTDLKVKFNQIVYKKCSLVSSEKLPLIFVSIILMLLCMLCHSFYHRMHQIGKIAGMDMDVGHSTIMTSMLVKEIMFAVQLEVLICSNM